MRTNIKKILEIPFAITALMVILYEEFFWNYVHKIILWVNSYQFPQKLGRLISQSHPFIAFLLFFIPTIVLFPVKLLALYFISQGQILLGGFAYIFLKIIGFAILKWIYFYAEVALRKSYYLNIFIDLFILYKEKIKTWAYSFPIIILTTKKIKSFKEKYHILKMELKNQKRHFIQFYYLKYKKFFKKIFVKKQQVQEKD